MLPFIVVKLLLSIIVKLKKNICGVDRESLKGKENKIYLNISGTKSQASVSSLKPCRITVGRKERVTNGPFTLGLMPTP